MTFEEAVRLILDGINRGIMFDSHFVINQLIKNHSDEYLRFCSIYANTDAPTLRAHQEIGKVIKRFDTLVLKQEQPSLSENIHGNINTCALWLKL